MTAPITFRYRWYWKPNAMRRLNPDPNGPPIDRRGDSCRILARAPAFNSVLVEFLDGYRCITSRHAVRCERHWPQGKPCDA